MVDLHYSFSVCALLFGVVVAGPRPRITDAVRCNSELDCAPDERCDEICSWSHPVGDFTGCAVVCVKRSTIGIPRVFEATIIKRLQSDENDFAHVSILEADTQNDAKGDNTKLIGRAVTTKPIRYDGVSELFDNASSPSTLPSTDDEVAELVNSSAPGIPMADSFIPLADIEEQEGAVFVDDSIKVLNETAEVNTTSTNPSNDTSEVPTNNEVESSTFFSLPGEQLETTPATPLRDLKKTDSDEAIESFRRDVNEGQIETSTVNETVEEITVAEFVPQSIKSSETSTTDLFYDEFHLLENATEVQQLDASFIQRSAGLFQNISWEDEAEETTSNVISDGESHSSSSIPLLENATGTVQSTDNGDEGPAMIEASNYTNEMVDFGVVDIFHPFPGSPVIELTDANDRKETIDRPQMRSAANETETSSTPNPMMTESVFAKRSLLMNAKKHKECPSPTICGRNCAIYIDEKGCQGCQCIWISATCNEEEKCVDSTQFCDLGRCQCKPGYVQDMERSGACKADLGSPTASNLFDSKRSINEGVSVQSLIDNDLNANVDLNDQNSTLKPAVPKLTASWVEDVKQAATKNSTEESVVIPDAIVAAASANERRIRRLAETVDSGKPTRMERLQWPGRL
ncbi:hypothetical protein Tcan_13003 [Toxocara canis]|uniref:EB domain-containing protein n=1 Tax=Toxocara canis TaxID=6265 RepID=A0A0B2V7L5_TOXCA|nr:hypothetical protein Tcan_13003 [Toxocara canis]